jgi:hypothetical protein
MRNETRSPKRAPGLFSSAYFGNAPSTAQTDASVVADLELTTPPLDQGNGWVRNTLAAKLDDVQPRTLARYRSDGIANAAKTLGRDRDGRIWRRTGTGNSHPWYLSSSLKSKATQSRKP